jgi:capsid portal protein
MRIQRLSGYTLGISEASELVVKKLAYEPVDLKKFKPVGPRLVRKSGEGTIIAPPFSMLKFLNLLDDDEYHFGCVDAIAQGSVRTVACRNAQVDAWLRNAEFPGSEDIASILAEMVRFYAACGNGFIVKLRNTKGEWVGCERLLPSETQIIEHYSDNGLFCPDYIQLKNYQRREYPNPDIIHFKRSTHRSNAWGLAGLPIAINIEILKEIKVFDYNNFRNGLLIDYFVIVEGGTLRDGEVQDQDGKTVIRDAYAEIEAVLREVKGNARSHSTVLIESENKDVHIRLEPLRQQDREGGFLELKKDLREGIFAYHRVPPRLVSQLIPGQLGGDNRTDMQLFHEFTVKPIQKRLALILSREFRRELPDCQVELDDWDFGDLSDLYQSTDEKLFNQNKIN